ncbi:MAG: aldose 1-epimerase family protein [Aureliella sp.]
MKVELPSVRPANTPPRISNPLSDEALSVSTVAGEFRCERYRMEEGIQAGSELLLVETDRVRVAICPTRGMSLWRAAIDGLECGWNSPVPGPVHPSFVPLEEPSGLGWLSGFDELLVRCGLRSFGAPDFGKNGQLLFPLHGSIGNLPASNVEIDVDPDHSLLTVSGTVHETRFMQWNLKLQAAYVIPFGEPEIMVRDQVVNASPNPASAQLLYHVNVGKPFLGQNAKLHLETSRVVARNAHAANDLQSWSQYLGPTAGYSEQVYFSEGNAGEGDWSRAILESAGGDSAFCVHYKTDTLPYFSQWKNTVAEADGYVTGLEPGTGFPNPRSFEEEKGRLVELAPGESREFSVNLRVLSQATEVQRVVSGIDAKGGEIQTAKFDPDWCVAE